MILKREKEVIQEWQVTRILIYHSNIQIGCGGGTNAINEAKTKVSDFVELINELRDSSGYKGEKCELDDSVGTYLYIINLEGFALHAGWLFAGMLYNVGWKFEKIYDNTDEISKAINPNYKNAAQIMRINMYKMNH